MKVEFLPPLLPTVRVPKESRGVAASNEIGQLKILVFECTKKHLKEALSLSVELNFV